MIQYQFGNQHSLPPKRFYETTQVHSNKYIYIKEESPKSIAEVKCDAMISTEPCTLLIKTADCLPIFAFNDFEISAIHAGWRGLKDHIVKETLSAFKTPPHTIVIGPHIRTCCFEVDQDCAETILHSINTALDNALTSTVPLANNKYKLNLETILRYQLASIWNGTVLSIPDCTCCNPIYASYRRNKTTQRNYSWITKSTPTAAR